MRTDNYGQIILSEKDLCNLYLQNPNRIVSKTLIDHSININDDLELTNIPQLIQYVTSTETVEEFDKRLQSNWYMPDEYKNLDIAKWILDQCQTDSERQRVGEELLLYLDRNLFQLLQYLKYLVDTMRKHNIVWGVGRGSSVASYVLYLIGVHRINSMYYDLDIEEFLR
jgi:DNA polymerase III alpha subunit